LNEYHNEIFSPLLQMWYLQLTCSLRKKVSMSHYLISRWVFSR